MKNIFRTLAAVAIIALSAACSKDGAEALAPQGDNASVSFDVQLPGGIASRATNDGTTATKLFYAVFEAGSVNNTDGAHIFSGNQDINLQTTVKLDLVSDQTYDIVFWAQAAAVAAPNLSSKEIALAYAAEVNGSDENRDAFIGFVDNLKVEGAISGKTVTLKRPFAQLNIALSQGQIDAAKKAGFELATVTVKAQSHNNFDFAAGIGNADDELMEVTFKAADYKQLEPKTISVNGKTYDWVSFNYLLPYAASEAQPTELINVEVIFTSTNGKTIEVPAFANVPIERNHRTNIVGDLLTDPANFNVVIEDEFEEVGTGDHNILPWDGTSIKKPAYNATEKSYTIKDAAELAWIAQLVNGTLPAESRAGEVAKAESLDGETILLAADINLGGHEWTPIGLGSNHFRGTFDGQNHTIYGLHITKRGDTRAALFGTVSYTVAFRNLTINGASIECPDYNGDFYGAAMVGTMYGNVTFDNVKVVDSYISGNNKVGALVAHDGVCSSLNIQNCHVSGTTFEALNTEDSGSVGGLVGFFQGVAKGTNAAPYGDHHVANSSVKKCVFNVINSTNSGKRANAQLIGGINSKPDQTLTIAQCVVENNTWNEKFYIDGEEVTTGTYVSPYGVLIGGDREQKYQGTVIIDGEEIVVATQQTLADKVNEPGATVNVPAGTYDAMPAVADGVTIIAAEGTVFEGKSGISGKNVTVKNITFKNPNGTVALSGNLNGTTFENCHFDDAEAVRYAYAYGDVVFNDCTFGNENCTRGVHFDAGDGTITFNRCKLYGFNALGGAVSMVTFNACEFLYNNYYNVMNMYNKYEYNNCSFNPSMFCDCAGNGVEAAFNGCSYTDGKDIAGIVRFDYDPATCKITFDGKRMASSAAVLKAALNEGGEIFLRQDIVMTERLPLKSANEFIIDGKGHTISQDQNFNNEYALFDDIQGTTATFKNIVFDGLKGGAAIRSIGGSNTVVNIDKVTIQNCEHTQVQGLLRLTGKSTITNSTFKNNTCSMVISLNYDGNNNDPQIVENCVFEGNTCNSTAVVYYVKGASGTINGNKFIDNRVNTGSGNGATVYMGFQENCTITNNLFQNNAATTTGTSKRVSGGLMIGYAAVITGNAFIGNTVTGPNAKGNDVCASVYYTDIDLSGNYWGGGAPVADDDYYQEYTNNSVIINDYLTTNPIQ